MRTSLWIHEPLFPAYLSAILLVIHLARKALLRNDAHTRPSSPLAGPTSLFHEAKQQLKAQDRLTIICKFLSLLGTLALAGLTVLAFLAPNGDGRERFEWPVAWSGNNMLNNFRVKSCATFITQDKWIEVVNFALYVRVIISEHKPFRSCDIRVTSLSLLSLLSCPIAIGVPSPELT